MTAPRRVWDPAVRVLHWALAASFALGWATTEWLGRWHEPVGYAALAIVAARIAWGFVGPRTARFAAFVRGPRATLAYARQVLAAREPRHLGHNPLGAVMVLALFACIGGLALTGWLYKTDRFWGDETVERIHLALAWTMLALVVVHIGGVALASFRHRENLVAAMFTGNKRAPEERDVA
ncbi:MAG: cytochrome b/b6 domain-containing protein [Burkholderiales bacterium]|nr:cytochrome b/b6 domain-containing protein [Burkholderiales bacterium]